MIGHRKFRDLELTVAGTQPSVVVSLFILADAWGWESRR